jgi:hypothetical protein
VVGGKSAWIRNTSGAAQTAEKMIGKLVINVNLWMVADQADHDCVHRSPDSNDFMLDSSGEYQIRKGTAFGTY